MHWPKNIDDKRKVLKKKKFMRLENFPSPSPITSLMIGPKSRLNFVVRPQPVTVFEFENGGSR